MDNRDFTASIFLLILLAVVGFSKQPQEKQKPAVRPPMPIHIAPYYDFEGVKIAVGKYSKKLSSTDTGIILRISSELKKDKDNLRAEVMYVTAIRLYDLGQKDESVYWFYTAQYRARMINRILDKNKTGSTGVAGAELKQAFNSFDHLAGTYINGYAFGDLEKLERTLTKVVDEAQGGQLPKYRDVYSKLKFIPEQAWDEENKKLSKDFKEFIEYIRTNADSIKKMRKENGIDDKY